jgi:hypothetical protein
VNGEEDAISKITFTIPNNISLERAAFFIYDPAKGIFEETFPISSGYKDKQAYFAVNITLPAQIMFGIRKTREDLENGLKENSISVPSIKKPFVMTGKIIFSDDSPAKEGITYEITNTRTNETVNGVIRKDLNAYAEVISGNIGDEVVMKIGRGNGFKEEKMKITGDVIHKDIDLGITSGDYEYVVLKDRVVRMVPYLIILLMFMAAGMVYLKMREVK